MNFKVGDKVRLVRNRCDSENPVGFVGEIVHIWNRRNAAFIMYAVSNRLTKGEEHGYYWGVYSYDTDLELVRTDYTIEEFL